VPAPKRILYVIATLDPAGAERQLVMLATHLDRGRFEPIVCCLTRGGPLEAELAAAGVETIVLAKRAKLDVSVVPRLVRLIRNRHIDLVHTWLFTGNAFGRAAAILAGDCKIVASERSVDRWRTPIHMSVDRLLATRTSRIIVNAEAVMRFYVEREQIPARKFVVIPNGLDLSRVEAAEPASLREELGLLPAARLIGCVARLEEQKGVEYLIGAAGLMRGHLPDAVFVVAGDGPKEAQLRQLVAAQDLEANCRLLGHRNDIPAFMAALDVLVLPSLWEGLPNVVLETMAAGCPVVATDIDGTRELVADGDSGLLVPVRNPQAISDAVLRLLSDGPLARRLAAKGTAGAQGYTIARMVERTQSVYDQLTEDPGAKP